MTTAQNVTIPGGTAGLNGYLVAPAGDGPYPGIVVIHEAFGLNDDIRSIADRFAQEGYIALAVDLFAGRNRVICMFRFFSSMFTNALNHGGIHDLRTTLTFLENQPNVDKNRLGAIGFCMGGSFAISWACTDERLKVVAPFYAMNPRPMDAVARACPVVGSYPEKDFTAGAGRKLDATLGDYDIAHDIKVYPGATHSFFNAAGGDANEAAAADAWERVKAFFAEKLS
ncbi:MAG: dienelactone hydrolase family protein [Anaerolineae bacterium]|nr:dienelactone hydrolase family protein [Anaerolineae bacterium]